MTDAIATTLGAGASTSSDRLLELADLFRQASEAVDPRRARSSQARQRLDELRAETEGRGAGLMLGPSRRLGLLTEVWECLARRPGRAGGRGRPLLRQGGRAARRRARSGRDGEDVAGLDPRAILGLLGRVPRPARAVGSGSRAYAGRRGSGERGRSIPRSTPRPCSVSSPVRREGTDAGCAGATSPGGTRPVRSPQTASSQRSQDGRPFRIGRTLTSVGREPVASVLGPACHRPRSGFRSCHPGRAG